MLKARKLSVWKAQYDLTQDDRPLARWDGRTWRQGGTIDLQGRRYDVSANVWGTQFEMTDPVGMVVARADRVGRRQWTVEAGGQTYQFRRTAWWRAEEALISGGQPVGSIRRVSVWRSDAEADLPGLPLPVQVFVFVVTLTRWDAQASAGG